MEAVGVDCRKYWMHMGKQRTSYTLLKADACVSKSFIKRRHLFDPFPIITSLSLENEEIPFRNFQWRKRRRRQSS